MLLQLLILLVLHDGHPCCIHMAVCATIDQSHVLLTPLCPALPLSCPAPPLPRLQLPSPAPCPA